MRLLTLVILWILRHCYLVAQLYMFLGSLPRYYLGLNEKVKIKSCFLMCCRTTCSKTHLFIMLRNRFLSHRPCGGWLAYILKLRISLEWAVHIGESSYLILWATWFWKPCSVSELIFSLAAVLSNSAEAFLAWAGYSVRDTWIWIMALKTQRLKMGLLLIMRAVSSERAPGEILETKLNS